MLYSEPLAIKPCVTNAVTCTNQHIFIAQEIPPLVSVHNWVGDHLCDLDHTSLGLGEAKYIKAIGKAQGGGFSLAVGETDCVSSLCLFKLL